MIAFDSWRSNADGEPCESPSARSRERGGRQCDREGCRLYVGVGSGCAALEANDGPRTLEEVAEALGVTRQRIEQVEEAALAKLLAPSRRHVLQAFTAPDAEPWHGRPERRRGPGHR